jgi:PAS domain S-box-containing protein
MGSRGMTFGVVALLLLFLGAAAAVTATALSFRLVTDEHNHVVARELERVDDSIRETSFALLVVAGTEAGEPEREAVNAAWRATAARVTALCHGTSPAGKLPETGLSPACTRFEMSRPAIDAMLQVQGKLSPDGLALVVARLREVSDLIGSHAARSQAIEDQQAAMLRGQRVLIVVLVVGSAGSLVSGLILLRLFAGAAALNRRRWLEASQAEHDAAEARAQLVEAIEAIPVGFGLYDRAGRMKMFNRQLTSVHPELYQPEIIGKHYEEVVRRATDRRRRMRPHDDNDAFERQLLARFQSGTGSDLTRLPNGRWLEAYEIRTPSGFIASLRVDVTALKQREQALEQSERRYRQIVDSMLDVVFTSDTDGHFTYISSASRRVLGLEPDEMVGRFAAALVHPDDRKRFGDSLRAARGAPQEVQSITLRGGRSLEAMRHVEVRYSASGEPDANGRLPFAGVIRDVHERVLMEERQRHDTLKLRAVLESTGAMILLVGRDLRIVLANRTFLAVTNKSLEDVVGRRFDEVVDCQVDKKVITTWLASDRPQHFEPEQFDNTLLAPDGTRRIVRVNASPVQDAAGRVDYILFLGVDETARRSAEIQVLDSARLATVGQMATGMAHEINQPLTVIQFAAESMLNDVADGLHRSDIDDFESELNTRLNRITAQTQRAANIVRELRIFARKPTDKPAPFDVAQAINGAVDLVAQQLRLSGIDLHLDLAPSLPAVTGHPNRLQQVLINLATNARDAIEEARTGAAPTSGRGSISIAARHDAGRGLVVVEVADNGTGIPDHVLPHLFEAFFTTKPSGKGTGLGLSISAEIVREMNGTLAAENRPEGGALFRMSFPIAREMARHSSDASCTADGASLE